MVHAWGMDVTALAVWKWEGKTWEKQKQIEEKLRNWCWERAERVTTGKDKPGNFVKLSQQTKTKDQLN